MHIHICMHTSSNKVFSNIEISSSAVQEVALTVYNILYVSEFA
jgi:hypothetical protein